MSNHSAKNTTKTTTQLVINPDSRPGGSLAHQMSESSIHTGIVLFEAALSAHVGKVMGTFVSRVPIVSQNPQKKDCRVGSLFVLANLVDGRPESAVVETRDVDKIDGRLAIAVNLIDSSVLAVTGDSIRIYKGL